MTPSTGRALALLLLGALAVAAVSAPQAAAMNKGDLISHP